MKYIEELVNGDSFTYNKEFFVLTSDFKKDNSRLSFNIKDGSPRWFSATEIVNKTELYFIDENNNIVPIKETKKDNS